MNSLFSKSSWSQVNGMYSGSQAEVQAKNRRGEKAQDGHYLFSTYCQVYWEGSTAVAVLDKWECFHFVPIGKRTFCIRMEVHGELFTRGLNAVSMKEVQFWGSWKNQWQWQRQQGKHTVRCGQQIVLYSWFYNLTEIYVFHLLILLASPSLKLSLTFKIAWVQQSVPFHITNIHRENSLDIHICSVKRSNSSLNSEAPFKQCRYLFCDAGVRTLIYLPAPRLLVSILAQGNDLIPEIEPFHFLIFKNIIKNKASWQQPSSFHNKLWGRCRTLWKHWLVTLLWHAKHI